MRKSKAVKPEVFELHAATAQGVTITIAIPWSQAVKMAKCVLNNKQPRR